MPTLRLCITGLRDADDEGRVERTLVRETGVFGAVADAAEGFVEVDYEDDEVSLYRLIDVLREAGFDARLGG